MGIPQYRRNTVTMNYRKINNRIADTLSPLEAYTYFCLTMKSDFETYHSNVNQISLAETAGVCQSTIQEHITKFEQMGLIMVNRQINRDDDKTFRKNQYLLLYDKDEDGLESHYVYIDGKIINEPIKRELKGFLILLKIRCLNYTNICAYSVRELADTLTIGKSMVNNYLMMAEETGYIKRDKKKNTIQLLNDEIFIVARETDIASMRRIYPEVITDDMYDKRGHAI